MGFREETRNGVEVRTRGSSARLVRFTASLVSAFLLACSGSSLSCGAVGCGPAISFQLPLGQSLPEAQKLSIEVCLKGRCGTGAFASVTVPPAAGSGNGVGIESAASGDGGALLNGLAVFLWSDGTSGFRADVEWFTGSEELRDGDTFRLSLKDASGNVVSSLEEKLTYAFSYPNGKKCDIVPCKHAVITSGLRDR